MQNHSYENDFDLHENETACRTHFHMKGFAIKFVLKQRHKRTRKWPIPERFQLSFEGLISVKTLARFGIINATNSLKRNIAMTVCLR